MKRRLAILDDDSELPYDLFLGVPKHRVPDVVLKSGMKEDGWIPVDSGTLKTRFPDVYAVGDVANVGVPRAGVFAEGQGSVVAAVLIARVKGGKEPPPYSGAASCYVEFGEGKAGRVHVDFLSGRTVKGAFEEPSVSIAKDKVSFGASRRKRWFGT